jgi:tetratricopeptide (TPR) repeat protein
LAQIRFTQWKWHEVEIEHKLAIKLSPRYATAYHWYALYLAARDKLDGAWEQILIARQLDPLSPSIIGAQALFKYLSGQYDETIAVCQEGLNINPNFPLYLLITGWSLIEKESYEQAITCLDRSIELATKWLQRTNDHISWKVYIGRAYALMGDYDKAKEILAEIIKKTKGRNIPLFPIAALYFSMGEIDQGFEWMEKAVAQRDFWVPIFRLSPVFNSVRDDPRFVSLMIA